MDFINWLYSLQFKIRAYPVIIQISIVFIYMSIFMSVFFLVYLTILRRIYAIRERLQKKVAPEITKLFKKILFENYLDTEEDVKKQFENTLRKNDKRRFLKRKKKGNRTYEMELAIDTLIRIRNSSNEDSERYPLIINALKIEKYLNSKFSFSTSGTKKKAIHAISELGISNSDSTILSYTYSSNDEVQTEARLSYLNLSKNDPYRFFDELKGEMTMWSQVKLMNLLLEQSNTVGLPNFGKWIGYSDNDSLVIFLLKAAAYFNQKKAIGVIRSKIKDPNHTLRAESILALGKLGDVEFEEELRNIYYNQPDICQDAIIKSVGFLETGESLEFLKTSFEESKNLDTKKSIALVIYDYGAEGKLLFAEMKENISKLVSSDVTEGKYVDSDNLYEDLLFKHAENDLILYK